MDKIIGDTIDRMKREITHDLFPCDIQDCLICDPQYKRLSEWSDEVSCEIIPLVWEKVEASYEIWRASVPTGYYLVSKYHHNIEDAIVYRLEYKTDVCGGRMWSDCTSIKHGQELAKTHYEEQVKRHLREV